MFDRKKWESALEAIVTRYETTAPTVSAYADWLYAAKDNEVTLADVRLVMDMARDWPQANYAANEVYHLQHRLGRCVEGQIGF